MKLKIISIIQWLSIIEIKWIKEGRDWKKIVKRGNPAKTFINLLIARRRKKNIWCFEWIQNGGIQIHSRVDYVGEVFRKYTNWFVKKRKTLPPDVKKEITEKLKKMQFVEFGAKGGFTRRFVFVMVNDKEVSISHERRDKYGFFVVTKTSVIKDPLNDLNMYINYFDRI